MGNPAKFSETNQPEKKRGPDKPKKVASRIIAAQVAEIEKILTGSQELTHEQRQEYQSLIAKFARILDSRDRAAAKKKSHSAFD